MKTHSSNASNSGVFKALSILQPSSSYIEPSQKFFTRGLTFRNRTTFPARRLDVTSAPRAFCESEQRGTSRAISVRSFSVCC